MPLAGAVSANEVGAIFTFPDGRTTRVTALFGVVDDVHTLPHSGCDLGLLDGTPVPCLEAGRVMLVSVDDSPWGSVFGNSVLISNGINRSLYAHLQETRVAGGGHVTEGQILGLSGHTGTYNGVQVAPHLHLGYGPESNPFLNKDDNGRSVARLLNPLLNLVSTPDSAAYAAVSHSADYLAGILARLARMAGARAPKVAMRGEVEAAAASLAALASAIDALPSAR